MVFGTGSSVLFSMSFEAEALWKPKTPPWQLVNGNNDVALAISFVAKMLRLFPFR